LDVLDTKMRGSNSRPSTAMAISILQAICIIYITSTGLRSVAGWMPDVRPDLQTSMCQSQSQTQTPPPSNYLFICVICLVFASVLLLFYALIVAGLSMTRAKLLALIFQAAYQAEFSPSQQQISISSQAS